MKTKIIVIIVVVGILGFAGVKVYDTLMEEPVKVEQLPTPVQVLKVSEKEYNEYLSYQGAVSPALVESISFKSSARLKTFNGQAGDLLSAGTILAELDTSDLELSKDAADSQLSAATADYNRAAKGARVEDIELARITVEKADEAVSYLEDQVAKLGALLEDGIVSQSEYDGIKLEYDLAVKEQELANQSYEKAISGTEAEIIQAALANMNLAKTNAQSTQMLIDDALYVLEEDRVLLEQMYETGELVPQGYPVAIVRSTDLIASIGVSSKDIESFETGLPVTVLSDSGSYNGLISRIAEIPDENHFLYEVEVSLSNSQLKVGEIVSCSIKTGTAKGIKIPIAAIMNDGIDYVYVVKEGKATMKKIVIVSVDEGQAVVDGLEEADLVIVSNLNRIQEQSLVTYE